ncbi:hypothetical protein [uncultured Methanobrevibacter sp.]|uniref:hypothetical protein n=1 Tax=uncultured Methanobrevibacter sp. TaxID=253161 RepID=UPI0025EBE677|nr:hypothetical protein [uncultured Methanobrevibacter sp.]
MALIFLVNLLCISAVSAVDDAATDVIADADVNDATVLEESIDDAALADSQNDEEILKDDPSHMEPDFAYLDNLIQKEGNEIDLISDINHTDTESYNDDIGINKDLIINGFNHTIDGNGAGRIFHISNNAVVTFKDITFVNAKCGRYSYGGAIWNEGSTVKVINCTFINNQADYGSAVAGGDVSTVDCENCIFISNLAEYYGTIFKGNAINCLFLDNYAFSCAAGIDQGTAINSTFINCHLYDGIDAGLGRGAAMTNSTAVNCTFIGNIAKNDGGAIYKSNATNCIFTNNTAKKGGAIYDGTATNCTFTGNNADFGGAIYAGNSTNCNFTKNNAKEGGATKLVNATNCNFIENHAGNGGAMYEGNAKTVHSDLILLQKIGICIM